MQMDGSRIPSVTTRRTWRERFGPSSLAVSAREADLLSDPAYSSLKNAARLLGPGNWRRALKPSHKRRLADLPLVAVSEAGKRASSCQMRLGTTGSCGCCGEG